MRYLRLLRSGHQARAGLVRQLNAMDATQAWWLLRDERLVFRRGVLGKRPVRTTVVARLREDDMLASADGPGGGVRGEEFAVPPFSFAVVLVVPLVATRAHGPVHWRDWRAGRRAAPDEVRALAGQLAGIQAMGAGVSAQARKGAARAMIPPSRLPAVRDRIVMLMSDPASALSQAAAVSRQAAGMDLAAGHLAAGELYWVSGDMAALAVAAASELDTVRWTAADRPSAAGLMVMDGGVGWLDVPQGDAPVDAISWGPDPDGLLLAFWGARQRLDEIAHRRADPEHVPPLVPLYCRVLPVAAESRPVASIPADIRALAATLAAAWHLMYQPALADRGPADVGKGIHRAYERAGRPRPEVTIIDLRSVYRPSGPEHDPVTEPGRYSHRWVVRGHWRNHAYGPAHSLRKRIWIPDYVKGPDGKPLLARERVNVWRR